MFKKINKIFDDKIGKIVLSFSSHGCMGQLHELQYVGIVERFNKDTEQYVVKIFGKRNRYYDSTEPYEYIMESKHRFYHKKDDQYILID